MANEITVSLRAKVVNGNLTNEFNPGTLQITQAAQGMYAPVVAVGTSEEDLLSPDVATPGIMCLRNLDATNYVDWGPKSGGSMVAVGRLKAGEVALIRIGSSVTIRWVANTASVKVQVWMLDS